MTPFPTRLAWLALTCALSSAPSLAESLGSAALSASSVGSQSIGSLSDSVRGSSNSSSRRNDVAAGEYRILALAELPARAHMQRLQLQSTAEDGGGFWLDVPRAALARQGLAVGDLIRARQRPYGFEFARADTHEPFFLALADDWMRELASHAVTL
ncbi:MAG: hypothetical protein Q8N44_09315 [Rubrivivax sp.]|nr:hypothetical protein [Rubrivivax sp.]MDP3083873.1 hypothetical protein [Rubrivivax sp.]